MCRRARLVLQQVHNLKRGTGFVVVIEARGVPGGDQALVDAEVLLVPVEDVHADLAERGAPVREGAVAERRPWIDENHRLNTANSVASPVRQGSICGVK